MPGYRVKIPVPYQILIYGPKNRESCKLTVLSTYSFLGDFLALMQISTINYIQQALNLSDQELLAKMSQKGGLDLSETPTDNFFVNNYGFVICAHVLPQFEESRDKGTAFFSTKRKQIKNPKDTIKLFQKSLGVAVRKRTKS